jgi:hypothetical protein
MEGSPLPALHSLSAVCDGVRPAKVKCIVRPQPEETGSQPIAEGKSAINWPLVDHEQVTPGVHSANHHSVRDECRSQGALGEHIQFPNLSRQRE